MRTYLFILLFFIIISSVSAQRVVKPDIQFVSLTDTFLIKQIRVFIEEEKKADTLFAKGFGHINLSYSFERRFREYYSIEDFQKDSKPRKDTVFTYILGTSFMSLDPKENTLGDITPPYYSFVGGG